jgi:hypothetical protein
MAALDRVAVLAGRRTAGAVPRPTSIPSPSPLGTAAPGWRFACSQTSTSSRAALMGCRSGAGELWLGRLVSLVDPSARDLAFAGSPTPTGSVMAGPATVSASRPGGWRC